MTQRTAMNRVNESPDIDVDFEGLEVEKTSEDQSPESLDLIFKPFDPTKIKVGQWNPTIQLVIDRIKLEEINLGPDFQRAGDIWSEKAKSQLIESLLIRIPLPAFYFDSTDENHMEVIDGRQRLTTLRDYVLNKSFALRDLEFLVDLKDKTFDQLPRQFQRRIVETQVTVFMIEKGTPPEVKYTIFKRINTSGLPLSAQEIRHALNQGHATNLLKSLAESDEFVSATAGGVKPNRMVDRELVLRFLAFRDDQWLSYASKDLDRYLNEKMSAINQMPPGKRSELQCRFLDSLRTSEAIFGNDSFRKRYHASSPRSPVNKALFEVWMVGIDDCDTVEKKELVKRRELLKSGFAKALLSDPGFNSAVSVNTNDPKNVKKRFTVVKQLIKEALNA
jgi:Protein of unknown function DUF262